MPEKTVTDKFANKFYGAVTESAANTLTFEEIQTHQEVFAKRAWIIHRLEWYMSVASINFLDATGDKFQAALVSTNQVTELDLSNAGVIDLYELQFKYSTAVGYDFHPMPIVRDFTELPGGGLIVAPRPLFLALKGTGASAAGTVACRGYFTQIDLSPADYLDLVDFYRIVS